LIDFHNHLLPAVDDGAQSVAEARAGLLAMRDAGVDTLVVTPHFQGVLSLKAEALEARLSEFDAAWDLLRAEAADLEGFRLERGVEVMLDIPSPDLSDPRLRLAGGTFVLVEFPFMAAPPGVDRALAGLRARGWIPIVAHPERYANVDRRMGEVLAWRQAGAFLQVNAGSVTGRYGPDAQERALRLLATGWVDYLCSDYHSRGRPSLGRCRDLLLEHGGAEQVSLLMEVNAGRMLAGEVPLPTPPFLVQESLWARIRKAFR